MSSTKEQRLVEAFQMLSRAYEQATGMMVSPSFYGLEQTDLEIGPPPRIDKCRCDLCGTWHLPTGEV